jgi:hypothetical protein
LQRAAVALIKNRFSQKRLHCYDLLPAGIAEFDISEAGKGVRSNGAAVPEQKDLHRAT